LSVKGDVIGVLSRCQHSFDHFAVLQGNCNDLPITHRAESVGQRSNLDFKWVAMGKEA
jgi:hypothetical protein